MYYVVTSKDLRNFLMGLGLTFKTDIDKKDVTREVYLFINNDKLHEALEFYSKFRYNK